MLYLWFYNFKCFFFPSCAFFPLLAFTSTNGHFKVRLESLSSVPKLLLILKENFLFKKRCLSMATVDN